MCSGRANPGTMLLGLLIWPNYFYQCTSVTLSIPTLSFYNNEPSKNKHFLILLSSLARNSQEPKLKRIFEIPWVLFEKSLSLYFDWPKSWIWRTLEKVMNIFCKWHFHNASKFFHSAKMALLNACMKFKIFWAKRLLLKHYESVISKKYL